MGWINTGAIIAASISSQFTAAPAATSKAFVAVAWTCATRQRLDGRPDREHPRERCHRDNRVPNPDPIAVVVQHGVSGPLDRC